MPAVNLRLCKTFVATTTVAVGLAAAGPAAAQQQQQQPPSTITTTGNATVKPEPADRMSETSIATAVREAKKKLLPLAAAAARARAVEIGQATGLTVGAVQSVSDAPFSPFFGNNFGEDGTFGPGRFCGTVGRFKFIRRDGRIVGRRRIGSRKSCRVPSRIATTLSITYAASPAR